MQDASPSQPPVQAVPADIGKKLQVSRVASNSRRAVNLVVDLNAYNALLFILASAANLLATTMGSPTRIRVAAWGAWGVWGLVGLALYYAVQEHLWGRTLGKFLTRTMVISADGGRPSLGQIIGRTFSRFIPFEPISYIIDGDMYPIGWHDRLSKTRVVERSRPPAANAKSPNPQISKSLNP
jgi:hypothetical protein